MQSSHRSPLQKPLRTPAFESGRPFVAVWHKENQVRCKSCLAYRNWLASQQTVLLTLDSVNGKTKNRTGRVAEIPSWSWDYSHQLTEVGWGNTAGYFGWQACSASPAHTSSVTKANAIKSNPCGLGMKVAAQKKTRYVPKLGTGVSVLKSSWSLSAVCGSNCHVS